MPNPSILQINAMSDPARLLELYDDFAQSGRMFCLGSLKRKTLVVIGQGGMPLSPPNGSLSWKDALIAERLLVIAGTGRPTFGVLESTFDSPTYLSRLPVISNVHCLPAWHFDGSYRPACAGLMHNGSMATLYAGEWPALPEADPTFPLLKKWFSGIMFSELQGRGNLLGIITAMFARHTFMGFPHLVIGAPHMSSGKTAVAEAIAFLLTGERVTASTYKSDQDRFETYLGTRFADQPGPSVIFIDNVNAKRGGAGGIIANQALAGMAAASSFGLNKHYSGVRPVFSPIVIFTFNNARVQADLRDKVVQVHLTRDPKEPHRNLDPHPLTFVEQNRLGLLAEIGLIYSQIHPRSAGQIFPIRYYDAAHVAQSAAQILGETYNYDPASNESADGLLQEIYYALDDGDDGRTMDLQTLTRQLGQNGGEAQNLLEGTNRSLTGRVKFFRQYIMDNIVDREHKFLGKVFKIAFGGKGVRLEIINE